MKKNKVQIRLLIIGMIVFYISFSPKITRANQKGRNISADIVVYGGTSAAIVAAVEAVQLGKSVLVLSPDSHLGGLSSGGLGFSDTGNKSVIGGLSREFYNRVWKHYNTPEAWTFEKHDEFGNKGQGTVAMDGENRTMWIFEPHVAESVFEDMVRENHIRVLRNEWLDREKGVKKKNGKIISIKTLSGRSISGSIFIDATYEGDLMAAAGVSYFVGREAAAVYNESYNGVQANIRERSHFFKDPVDPYRLRGNKESGLLYGISAEPIAPNSSGDKKVQAYCFRLCMTDCPENRIPFPKPSNYNPDNYELLARFLEGGVADWFAKYDRIPNKKTDTNNHGPFSSDFIGGNYEYPEASYEKRREIIAAHETYQKGLLYFLCNDHRLSAEVRTRMGIWGLAADEFKDNANWPRQLYIREARRMKGEFVTTQGEVTSKNQVPDPVGMGSYGMDSHNVQRYLTADGHVQNEGDVEVYLDRPYPISYRSLLPKREECTNLLVPVCLSASHIAYGSIRMEPVFMILGQSAAVAASLAIDHHQSVQDVSYVLLKKELLGLNQVLQWDGSK